MQPLTVEIKDNPKLTGWKISNLTSPDQLQTEGQNISGKMGTCISGFADSCMSGEQHVFLFRNKNGESEAYFRAAVVQSASENSIKLPNGQHLDILYHTGPHNTSPSETAKKAYTWFKKEVEAGRITIDTSKQGIIDSTEKPVGTKLIGYDPSNGDKLQQVFDIFAAKNGNPVGQILRAGERTLIPGACRHLKAGDYINRKQDFSLAMKENSYGEPVHTRYNTTITEMIKRSIFRDCDVTEDHDEKLRYWIADNLGLNETDKLTYRQSDLDSRTRGGYGAF
ncbi:MAG: hypothetical protein ACK502_01295 [Alphaproteobacteria bacterium]